MSKKYLYYFSEGNDAFGGDKVTMKNILGGKGAGLAEMTAAGMPVPQGFTITTEACTQYYADGRQINDEITADIFEHVKGLEKITGKTFGDNTNPLLVSVRSGARQSMPGMMDTILNLGLNDEAVEGLAKKMGCDPATLQATYDRYCELVEKGVDEDFGKPAEFLHPIKGPKFVALRMHPCVTVTFGGLETDVSARVMKPDGSVIPHLYAAGEVAGTGMYGTQYPTCGTSIGSALFYGRIAGRAVTDQALL